MEVFFDRKNFGFVVGNFFFFVILFMGEFDSSFNGFSIGVYRENYVVIEYGGNFFSKGIKVGGVESLGRKGEFGGLGDKGVYCKVDEFGMIDGDLVC